MRRQIFHCVLFLALIGNGTAMAEDFSDPTWPCVQRKVENLSPGLMWPHPLPETADPLTSDERDLVETLVLRRVSLDDVQVLADEYAAATAGVTAETAGKIFLATFDKINRNRSRLIDGIGRYSLAQIDVAARVDSARLEMDSEMQKEDPDFDRIDALEEQLDWDQRIYRDRTQSLLYVCETPVLLEKRLFGIAQSLSSMIAD